MRFRSFMAILVIAIASLGFVGCGSSSDSFVATGNPDGPPTTGDLTFNFATVAPQAPFTVDAATDTLRFEFFDGVDAEPVLTVTRDFAASITIEDVPATVRSVLITGFDANRFPLFTINQTVRVEAGQTTTVEGINNPVPVTLSDLFLTPGSLFAIEDDLDQIDVQVGGTSQVFLFAAFSNGSVVLVGDKATYSIAPGGEAVASVSSLATVSGLSAGTATFLAQFEGQTLSRPVIVGDGLNQTLSSISVTNVQPIVAGSTAVQINTVGVRTSDGQQFGLNPSSLSYSAGPNFTVTSDGMITANDGVESGTMGTLTVTWTNPGGGLVTTEAPVQAE